MRTVIIFILLVAALGGVVALTQPAQNPCAQAEMKTSMAEAKLEAEQISSGLKLDALGKEIAKLKEQLVEAGQQLSTEQKNSARLTVVNEVVQQSTARLILERNTARDEARRAKTWKRSFLRVFGKKK